MSVVLLHWDYSASRWTTNSTFAPNAKTTYGGQYFILPPYIRVENDVVFFDLVLPNSTTKGEISGSISVGAGKDHSEGGINSGDVVISGNISNVEQANLTTNELKYPQGVFSNFVVTFIPAINLKIQVKGYT